MFRLLKQNNLKPITATLVAALIVYIPMSCYAFCPGGMCTLNKSRSRKLQKKTSAPNISYVANNNNNIQHRNKSHNMRDVKNSVLGDVNIRIGHKRLDVYLGRGAKQNLVDASISSTIILGDMKQ